MVNMIFLDWIPLLCILQVKVDLTSTASSLVGYFVMLFRHAFLLIPVQVMKTRLGFFLFFPLFFWGGGMEGVFARKLVTYNESKENRRN